MKSLLLMFAIAATLTTTRSTYGSSIIGGPGSIAFVNAGTKLHTAGGWGFWNAGGGIRFCQVVISKDPPVNDRMVPIISFATAPYKNAFLIKGLPPGTYYCVVWPNGIMRGRSSGVHRFVVKNV